MGALIFIAVLFLFYMLPALIAFNRRHRDRVAILAVNLIFGWTVLGWGIAIVWSLTGNVAESSDGDDEDEEKDADEALVKCDQCAELIKPEAKICRFCKTPRTSPTVSMNRPAGDTVTLSTSSDASSAPRPGDRICPKCQKSIPEGVEFHQSCFKWEPVQK